MGRWGFIPNIRNYDVEITSVIDRDSWYEISKVFSILGARCDLVKAGPDDLDENPEFLRLYIDDPQHFASLLTHAVNLARAEGIEAQGGYFEPPPPLKLHRT